MVTTEKEDDGTGADRLVECTNPKCPYRDLRVPLMGEKELLYARRGFAPPCSHCGGSRSFVS